MIKKYLPLLFLLTACSTGNSPAQTSSSTTTNSLIVQSLTPLCASTLKDQKVIPDQAKKLSVDEKAVCECGLRKVETKLTSNPALFIDVLRSTDAQIKLLVDVGTECSGELLKKALLSQLQPSPAPSATPLYPYPMASPSTNPSAYPSPAPTFWPPSGP